MSDWTEKYSSLELLENLKQDVEMLQGYIFYDDIDLTELANNAEASLSAVDALIRRQNT